MESHSFTKYKKKQKAVDVFPGSALLVTQLHDIYLSSSYPGLL